MGLLRLAARTCTAAGRACATQLRTREGARPTATLSLRVHSVSFTVPPCTEHRHGTYTVQYGLKARDLPSCRAPRTQRLRLYTTRNSYIGKRYFVFDVRCSMEPGVSLPPGRQPWYLTLWRTLQRRRTQRKSIQPRPQPMHAKPMHAKPMLQAHARKGTCSHHHNIRKPLSSSGRRQW